MHAPTHTHVQQLGAGLENERESEIVWRGSPNPHSKVSVDHITRAPEPSIPADNGVVRESVWLGDFVEHVAGVREVAGASVHCRDSGTGGGVGAETAEGEVGVDLAAEAGGAGTGEELEERGVGG